MTGHEFDRIAERWLRDGPTEAPDRGLQAALDEVHLTRQRRYVVAGGHQMRLTWQVAAALTVSLLLLGLGAAWVGRQTVLFEATVTPSPVAPAATPGLPRLLEAGTYTTAAFRPALTYTVPKGWSLTADEPERFGLGIEALAMYFEVSYDPVATTSDAKVFAGVGTEARALADFVATNADLELISGPTEWEQGGLHGWWLDVHGRTDADVNVLGQRRPGETACVGAGQYQCAGFSILPDQLARVGFLDVPGGRTIVIWITQLGGEGVIGPATTIVESFEFAVPATQ
jgi:hypothetical protein